MMHGDRAAFEHKLKEVLQDAGIECNLLHKDEIISRVFENDFAISRLSDLFLQFITRSKRRGWSADEVAKTLSKNPDKEPRSMLFHQLALRAYREYELMLAEENAMDFDDLLMQACEEVESRGGDVGIHLGQGKMIAIRNLKWILLDEYQDFSELYFRMLRAILECLPEVRLVAVGDDWQAINSFAGAQLRFFEDFASYFPGGETVGVTTNYRSDRAVVGAGNLLMAGRGDAAKISRNAMGLIRTIYLSDSWIEFRQGNQFAKERDANSIYLPPRTDGKNPSELALRQAQALKACAQIIIQDPAKKTLLLARTGRVYGLDAEGFREKLIKALSTFDGIETKTLEQNLSIMTAHGSKGQESSRVIILDVTKRQFPKIHPDNLLFELFGVTPHTVLEEERRLFYVAMTRAEHELYLVTEKGEESHYLAEISGSAEKSDYKDIDQPIPLPLGDLAQRIQKMMSD
jgi:DNA helicase-4